MRISRHSTHIRGVYTVRYKYKMRHVVVNIFKRKLPVSLIIRIIDVFTPVMHGKEISKRNVGIAVQVFYIVFNKYGHLKQLLKQAVIKVDY